MPVMFRIVPRAGRPDEQVVEVVNDDAVCAVICSHEELGMKIVSPYLGAIDVDKNDLTADVTWSAGGVLRPPIPSITARFTHDFADA